MLNIICYNAIETDEELYEGIAKWGNHTWRNSGKCVDVTSKVQMFFTVIDTSLWVQT